MSALNGRILEGSHGLQYRVEDSIDLDDLGSPKGAMARVFRVVDLQENRYLAAKIINPRLLDEEPEMSRRFLGQFYKEARIMEELQHPGIVRLYDYNTQGDLPFLIMDFIEGETLDDRLRREGRLSFEVTMSILEPVALALAYAHSRGVVHRDLKPSNILLNWQGQAYLTDFGIARAAQESGLSTRTALTMGSYQFGTPMYMAPEQALRLAEAVGSHTDQYSLAVVVWRMIAGRHYLVRSDMKEVSEYSAMVIGIKPQPLSRYAPTIPPRAEQAIAKALSKSPYDRFPNVIEFLDELRRALANPDWAPIADPLSGWEEPAWLTSRQAKPKLEPEAVQAAPALAVNLETPSAGLQEKAEAFLMSEQEWLAPVERNEKESTQPLNLTLPEWFDRGNEAESAEIQLAPAEVARLEAEPVTEAKATPNQSQPLMAKASQSQPLAPRSDPWVLQSVPYPGADAEPGRYRLTWNTAAKQEKWAYEALQRRLRRRPPLFLLALWPVLSVAVILAFYSVTEFPWFVKIPLSIAIATLLTLPFLLGWWFSVAPLKSPPLVFTGWLVKIGGPYQKTSSGKIILKEGKAKDGQPSPCTLSITTSLQRANEPDQIYTCTLWDRDKLELPANSLRQRVAIATLPSKGGANVNVVAIKVLPE